MKHNTVFKRAYNESLAMLALTPVGGRLGTESELAVSLGVSRTTVRSVLQALQQARLIALHAREKIVVRPPTPSDYFDSLETQSAASIVEQKFLRWIVQEDPKPAQQVNAMDLARQFGVSTSAVREYLGRFGQFGLLEHRENGGWVFKGFTEDFALELSEVRDMFERRSVEKFLALPADHPAWAALATIEVQHTHLQAQHLIDHSQFSELDERFHRLINTALPNRFMSNFYLIISMIFHYHYQWNKADAAERNRAALKEHMTYIQALRSGDPQATLNACNAHLATARQTLLRSIKPD